ncbi:MAG: SIR2 family protein [Bacteroidales bacterium]|nr:SIR2 family protein [Bacteroidales bacterium]
MAVGHETYALSLYSMDDFIHELEDEKAMAFFVGTGIDMTNVYPEGFPQGRDVKAHQMTWKQLLEELICHACVNIEERRILTEYASDLQAAVLKQKLGSSYIPIIQSWLYSRCNRRVLEASYVYYDRYRKGEIPITEVPFYSQFVLGETILLSRGIRAVVSQNYNNFISDTISILQERQSDQPRKYRDIKAIEVYDGWREEKYVDNAFLIYHVHGYIPSPSGFQPKKEGSHIVLSQEEFYEMSKDVFSWQNSTQIHFLTHHTCVLLGLSLNDLTTLRVLRHANLDRSSEKVYGLMAIAGKNNTADQIDKQMKCRYFQTQHLHMIVEEDGYPALYDKMLNSVYTHYDRHRDKSGK